ncbi:hypothetical protein OAA60_05515 [Porticoccaceae bacterium]|nr:hypothetical protein [Porticoccaceae bacterium]
MDNNTPATIAAFFGGATVFQGFAQLVEQNATFITTMSIAFTAFVGFVSFIWGKVNERKRINIEERRVIAMEQSNKINMRALIDDLLIKLDMCNDECLTKCDIIKKIRK